MRYIICVILAAAHVFTPASAKPRLNNSELTYQLACLEGGNSSKERVELCKAALEDVRLSDGDRLRLMLSLADAQTWESDYEGAMGTYTDALALNPNSPVAYEGLGWVGLPTIRTNFLRRLRSFAKQSRLNCLPLPRLDWGRRYFVRAPAMQRPPLPSWKKQP